ncbi:MAG: sensor histidine kinase [Brumimicrobium sp.]|nr:sensor histidine kinase [Brumimicrobium sp.]
MKHIKEVKLNFSEYQELAKFNFVMRILIMCSAIIFILSIFSYIIDSQFFEFYLGGFFVLLMAMILLRIYGRRRRAMYKYILGALFIAIMVLLTFSIFTVKGTTHFMESFWMLIIIIASFFILGNFWGFLYAISSLIVYSIYYLFFFKDNLDINLLLNIDTIIRNAIEYSTALLIVAYVMFEYGRLNKYALIYAEKALEELKSEKITVENQNIEKTFLLQEIHHRVKNNLQIIVSLLRLQSNDLETEEARNSYQDTINRIMSMSLIHQKLYEKESFIQIDLVDYINSLIETLISTYSTDKKVTFQVESELHSVQLNRIPSLGLIINELVTNSLKHAFTTDGHIFIKINKGKEQVFYLNYSDNGTWKEAPRNNSFGIKLIDIFTEQLDGEYKRESNENGTIYSFVLKN